MHSKKISLAWRLALAIVLAIFVGQPAQAQTFTVLHNFTGGQDGAFSIASLTMDRTGNLMERPTGAPKAMVGSSS